MILNMCTLCILASHFCYIIQRISCRVPQGAIYKHVFLQHCQRVSGKLGGPSFGEWISKIWYFPYVACSNTDGSQKQNVEREQRNNKIYSMLWTEFCSSQIHILKSQVLVSQNITIFGGEVFKR